MKNKKGVIGIIGTLLIVVMVISFSSPRNSADENFEEVINPYEEVMYELNDSINRVAHNNDRIKAIDSDVENYRDQLEGMIDAYESLNNDLKENLNGLDRLSDVVEKTKKDSGEVELKLDTLRGNVQENEEKFNVENSGIRISPIFILMFLLVNCVVWVQVSSYYKKKYVC
jgi:peptidoglycan hydrolase CwlO-like protein